jgi:predicted nucleic acid-binding protein
LLTFRTSPWPQIITRLCTTVTIAEVLAGPLRVGDEALTARYRAILESWRVVDLTASIAGSAACLGAALRLKLADAVQAASASAINAEVVSR